LRGEEEPGSEEEEEEEENARAYALYTVVEERRPTPTSPSVGRASDVA
jgi:hypothetical protein